MQPLPICLIAGSGEPKCNAVTLELQAIGMRENRVSGWSTENVATISLHRADEGSIHLRAQGSGLEILMTFGWLRVKGILPYRKVVESE